MPTYYGEGGGVGGGVEGGPVGGHLTVEGALGSQADVGDPHTPAPRLLQL